MCGIFGYFDRTGEIIPGHVLKAMGASIKHRGPDDEGIFQIPGAALGNQRLSIMDVEGGHQPFVSDDGQIVVVQNGEIFNHVELAAELAGSRYACRTHCDTEVLLRLYERDGLDFLDRLNGMFAFAILDLRVPAMFLVRDRIGVKPLYVAEVGSRLIFGSEIKAVSIGTGLARQLDLEALSHYLTFNYVPVPHTMHAGVRHVMPGHALKITPHGVKEWRWWDLSSIAPDESRSEESWIEEFNAILEDAVRIRMRSDVPFGAFLSGGVDSSTIVGLMARNAPNPVKTFCIGFDDPRFDESPYAAAAAERFATDHVMRRVDPEMLDLWPKAIHHLDQPHGDISFLPTYRVSELAAEHVKVVLTGDGGDELFAGYDKYAAFFNRPDADAMDDETFQRRYFESISLFSNAEKTCLLSSCTKKRLDLEAPFEIAREWFADVPHQDRINQALYLDMQLLLSGNNLVKPDRMGMAVSIEPRTPFLDFRMMEFAFRMPGHFKFKDGITKYIYKKAVTPLIGRELAYRKKQMFTVPVGEWFRDRLATYCTDHIASLAEKCDLFDGAYLRTLAADHISNSRNNTRELRNLIALDLWLTQE